MSPLSSESCFLLDVLRKGNLSRAPHTPRSAPLRVVRSPVEAYLLSRFWLPHLSENRDAFVWRPLCTTSERDTEPYSRNSSWKPPTRRRVPRHRTHLYIMQLQLPMPMLFALLAMLVDDAGAARTAHMDMVRKLRGGGDATDSRWVAPGSPVLTLEAADEMANAAVKEARERGFNDVAVFVLDAKGRTIVSKAMLGVPNLPVKLAHAKAMLCVSTNSNSRAVRDKYVPDRTPQVDCQTTVSNGVSHFHRTRSLRSQAHTLSSPLPRSLSSCCKCPSSERRSSSQSLQCRAACLFATPQIVCSVRLV